MRSLPRAMNPAAAFDRPLRRSAGQLYELTGPRLLTFSQAIEEIARASGREVKYQQISPEVFATALAEQHVPADEVALLTYLFTTVLDGRNAHLTAGVQRALGRPPRDFSDYARLTAATGIWGQPGDRLGIDLPDFLGPIKI